LIPQSGIPEARPPSDLSTQVYAQLRHIAEMRLASQPAGHTLQATALVHEAYLKLQNHPSVFGLERAHFFRVAAEAMRQILIDHARSKGRQKRGGGAGGTARRHAVADVAQLAAEQDPEEILALEEALRRFEQLEPRAAEVVKLRFFAGLTVEEASEVTGLSVRTVNREWKFARAWLFKALE
jgi:RNA polymerase sigma factor (TIGR02999 family)